MIIFKRLFLGLIFTISLNITFAIIPSIPKSLTKDMSVIVIDDKTSKIIYSHNPDIQRLVASNMKMLTAAIALEVLTPDFRWHTKLSHSGTISNGILNGNLYIIGGGDPTFDAKSLNDLLAKLKSLNIKQINGDIIIDNTIFNSYPTYSVLYMDKYDTDTILPNGFMVDGNLTKFNIYVKQNKINIANNLYKYKIVNNLRVSRHLSTCSAIRNQITLTGKTITFNGAISRACNGMELELNLLPVKDYAIMSIQRTIDKMSIKLTGSINYDATKPKKASLIYDYASQSLQDVLVTMNRYSVNILAETVFLSLGAYATINDNTYIQAKRVYNEYLKKHHIFHGDTHVENGAGLSRYERMTANDMGYFLSIMSLSEYSANFENTLPRSGGCGTLRGSFTSFYDRVRFKTGTLNDSKAYSGYFYTKNNTKYVVVIFANDIDARNNLVMKSLSYWINGLLKNLERQSTQ